MRRIVRWLNSLDWDIVLGLLTFWAFSAWFFGMFVQVVFAGREVPTTWRTWVYGTAFMGVGVACGFGWTRLSAWATRPPLLSGGSRPSESGEDEYLTAARREVDEIAP